MSKTQAEKDHDAAVNAILRRNAVKVARIERDRFNECDGQAMFDSIPSTARRADDPAYDDDGRPTPTKPPEFGRDRITSLMDAAMHHAIAWVVNAPHSRAIAVRSVALGIVTGKVQNTLHGARLAGVDQRTMQRAVANVRRAFGW